MKRLLNKKGFTMVELIVVIAIMAILLAMVIPMLSISSARENEAKEYARSFYSNVQELMTDEKLNKSAIPGGNTTTFMLVAARVDESDINYDDIEIYMSYSVSADAAGTVPSFAPPEQLVDSTPNVDNDADGLDDRFDIIDTSLYKDFGEFVTSLRKMLLGNDRSGWFYAVVDVRFRVVSAYFTYAGVDEANITDAFAQVSSEEFTADCRIGDGVLTGSWPTELCEKGKKMFELP